MEDVLARLKVEGSPVYDSEGKLYLTSVGIDDNVRFYEALLDMANRDVELVPRADLYPDEQDSDEIDEENAVLMDMSKEAATVVALRGSATRSSRPGSRSPRSSTAPRPTASCVPATASSRSTAAPWPAPTRSGRRSRATRSASGSPSGPAGQGREEGVDGGGRGRRRAGSGSRSDLFADLPVKVSVETENNIGGPSAGLMFTLSIIDKLTPETLTAGRRIAGTGASTSTAPSSPSAGWPRS